MAQQKQTGTPTTIPAPADIQAAPSVVGLFARFAKEGPNREYKRFESRLKTGQYGRRAASVWEFIEDAVNGTGGFSDGSYIFPFKGEVSNTALTDKLLRRQSEADYDKFAEHVCNAAWDLIVSAKDLIERKADGEAADLLNEFWESVDGHGTAIVDFLEYPNRQGRMFTVGFIFMDRPNVDLQTKADDLDPSNRPWIYAVPTRNVVDWMFDDDDRLVGIVMLEPESDDETGDRCPVRVWTLDGWAKWMPVQGKRAKNVSAYQLVESGPNELGMIPVVPVWNELPDPGKMLGQSEMLDVARLAQTVYNIDSEAREIERKCALFLAMPVKDVGQYDAGKAVIGNESMMLYDGEAGEPRWVSPDLTILDKLETRRQQKIQSAYDMAHLRALYGGSAAGGDNVVQTSSGYHAEVEFSKTERRISRHAAMLEWVEKQLAILYLKYHGIDAEAQPDLFSVTYPRDFGIRDIEKLIARTESLLEMNLGEESDRAALTKLFKGLYPRQADEKIDAMVEGALKSRRVASAQQSAVDRIRAMTQQVPKTTLPPRSVAPQNVQ
jgi:hypothetical protein